MDIAASIREARHEAGLSQVELADIAGTSQPALARYETGATLPTLPTLERLLRGCGRQLRLGVTNFDGHRSTAVSARGQLGSQARALRRQRRKLLDCARAHGIRKLRVFGSVARSEAHPDSDIDLLVELASGRTLLDLVAFKDQATEIMGVPVDVATADMLKERARTQALAEALPL
jgi:hypothetical protein